MSAIDEPQPVPAHKIAEITPAVPDTAEPFSGNMSKLPNGTASAPAPTAHAETAKTARKRVGFAVEPQRIISWDFRKLARPGG